MEPALFGGRIFHSRKKEAVSKHLGTLRRYVGETAALGGTGGGGGGEGEKWERRLYQMAKRKRVCR